MWWPLRMRRRQKSRPGDRLPAARPAARQWRMLPPLRLTVDTRAPALAPLFAPPAVAGTRKIVSDPPPLRHRRPVPVVAGGEPGAAAPPVRAALPAERAADRDAEPAPGTPRRLRPVPARPPAPPLTEAGPEYVSEAVEPQTPFRGVTEIDRLAAQYEQMGVGEAMGLLGMGLSGAGDRLSSVAAPPPMPTPTARPARRRPTLAQSRRRGVGLPSTGAEPAGSSGDSAGPDADEEPAPERPRPPQHAPPKHAVEPAGGAGAAEVPAGPPTEWPLAGGAGPAEPSALPIGEAGLEEVPATGSPATGPAGDEPDDAGGPAGWRAPGMPIGDAEPEAVPTERPPAGGVGPAGLPLRWRARGVPLGEAGPEAVPAPWPVGETPAAAAGPDDVRAGSSTGWPLAGGLRPAGAPTERPLSWRAPATPDQAGPGVAPADRPAYEVPAEEMGPEDGPVGSRTGWRAGVAGAGELGPSGWRAPEPEDVPAESEVDSPAPQLPRTTLAPLWPRRRTPAITPPTPDPDPVSTVDEQDSSGPVYRAVLDHRVPAPPPSRPETETVAVPGELVTLFHREFGVDVGSVPVHRGRVVSRRAAALGARAFTQGGRVFLPDEVGDPAGQPARALLAHELTHAVQQRLLGGAQPAAESADGRELEAAAGSVERWVAGSAAPPAALLHRTAPDQPAGEATQLSVAPVATDPPAPAAPPAPADSPEPPAPTSWSWETGFASAPPQVSATRAARTPEPSAAVALAFEQIADLRASLIELRTREPEPDQIIDLNDLAGRLYHRLRSRLRAELIIDRERAGALADIR